MQQRGRDVGSLGGVAPAEPPLPRVIVDAVINHMTGHGASGQGTGGSSFDGNSESYPAVPYSNLDFHQPYCEINNYGNVDEV